MGMDIEGGMVIGGRASDIKLDDDIDLGTLEVSSRA